MTGGWTCPKCGKTVKANGQRRRPPARPHRVRHDVRYPVEIPIHVAGLDLAYAGRSRDLSLHGALLEVPLKRLKAGRFAAVTLSLPRRGRSSMDIILPGDIRWAESANAAGCTAGIKFVHTESSLAMLSRLLGSLEDGAMTARLPKPPPPAPPPHQCDAVKSRKPRRDLRRRVELPVTVAVPDGAITGEVCDLSTRGLMLRSPYAVSPGRRVVVTLESPSVPVILPVEATVRWLRLEDDEAVAGLAFDHAPDAHIVRLFFDALGAEARPKWRAAEVKFREL